MRLRSLLLCVLCAPLFAASLGCNKEKSTSISTTSAQSCGSDLPADQVVAEWNDGKLTAGEVDKFADKQLKQIDEDARKQKFELRRGIVERMVVQKLVQAEAKKRGMMAADGGPDENAWVDAEIEKKVAPPTEEQMQALFNQVQERLPPGTTFEQVKAQLAPMAGQEAKQQRAAVAFDELKKQANVKILLTEPRKKVEAKGPSRGPENAKVTIVEFSDFECPFCGRAKTTVDKLMEGYAGKVRLVFRQYPLPMHPHAPKAAEAALCANDQGKFWEMHDQLFANQRALDEDKLPEYAKAVGVDPAKFDQCMKSGEKEKQVKTDMEAGDAVGVGSTPTFFINGREVSGALPEDEFKKIIDEELQSGS